MNILVLSGSPRPKGLSRQMVSAFRQGAEEAGHTVTVFDVCSMDIHGCRACEYCHTRGNGRCIQHDDMQLIYDALKEAELLVLASPIYYHNMSGQLKCAIDRFYSAAYPDRPEHLRGAAIILASGDRDIYDGALYSFYGDFVGYLELEDKGVFTVCGADRLEEKLEEAARFGRSLRD